MSTSPRNTAENAISSNLLEKSATTQPINSFQITSFSENHGQAVKKSSANLLRQSKVTTLFGTQKINKKTSDQIDKKLQLLFISDFQPFSVVEDSGFKAFVAALNPGYQLPSRHIISKTTIPALYEECRHKIKEMVKHGIQFCITTDCWTSRNMVSYMAVTGHFLNNNFELCTVLLECCSTDFAHTSENLAIELTNVVESWGIEDKILLAVSDNAANIKNAITVQLNWKYFGCFAHTLNLIVKDALKIVEISNIVHKVKQIVSHFKKSYKSNEKLMSYQKNAGQEPLKLLQDVETRWNSSLYMLQRFVQLEDAVKATIALIDKELPLITQKEWIIIKHLCTILKPFEDATKNVSGESYCSASLVIPITNGLINVYSKIKTEEYPTEILSLVLKIESGLKERLGNVEKSNTLAICTFLDPRFKNLAFSVPFKADNIKQIVTSAVSSIYSCQTDPIIQEAEFSEADSSKELSIWNYFDSYVAHHKPRGTTTSRAIIEVQRYLEDDVISRKADPLEWWRTNRFKYPKLSCIAQEYLCSLASSVPCERLFSKAGQVLNERRTRLNDKKTKMLLFLNSNYKYMK